MRYFNCVLNATSDSIKENTKKIRLKDYDYDTVIGAMNMYLSRNVDNDCFFFAYREEEHSIKAAFCYDEKKKEQCEVTNYFLFTLKDIFGVKSCLKDACEVTMFDFLDYVLECKRRGFAVGQVRDAERMNLWIYFYYGTNAKNRTSCHYEFEEHIVGNSLKKTNAIYDKKFLEELDNIATHENATLHSGNTVHYVISYRSFEAAQDMMNTLTRHLYAAKRISGRRVEIIRDMAPDFYCGESHIEETIENNYGGVIVIDLSEKFGHDTTEYAMAAKYLEDLLKKYRNQCLFIFTYNMNNPGFAYSLIPKIKKYIIPFSIREGSGSRKDAVKYMKELIKNSEYGEFAGQAEEFMKKFPGNVFSQSDVLSAFQQFEAWCLSRNILKTYDYDSSEEFILDRENNCESSYEKLKKMIGLDEVKKKIDEIIAENTVERERRRRKGKNYASGTMHMIFSGNPGTAKTTVAKLFANIAKEKGVLKSGIFVERGGMDLDGLGCVFKIRNAFEAAIGGVLFIDEAYSMGSQTAVTVLLQEMENHKDDVIVILAGYNDRMKRFLELNEGLKSRIPHWVDFPDYNTDELTEIFKMMLKERGFEVEESAVTGVRFLFDRTRNLDDFGNGRYVRNIIDKAIQKQSVRLLSCVDNAQDIPKEELFCITKSDIDALNGYESSNEIPGKAKQELDSMIGLNSVKSVINKAISGNKMKKICMEKGLNRGNTSKHMVFTGNPGTAKTTVARLFAKIMRDEGILASGNFVETGRADLVGKFVGHTAPLVKKKFKEAQGGVLFIDEAYSLLDGSEDGFGIEAIDTIVQEMENHRDDVIVIFAGYPKPMKAFLERNPGMRSRIAYQMEFEDYTVDELCEITKVMLDKKQMKITDQAMKKLRFCYEEASLSEDYGNGRFVRKMLEEAELNMAERIMALNPDDISDELLSTIEADDISVYVAEPKSEKRAIGFIA